MNSTDETQGEDVYGVDADSSQHDEFAPPRRRRSTYTPPPQYREPEPAPQAAVDTPVAEAASTPHPAPGTEAASPSYAVYSLDDGSLDAASADAGTTGAPRERPVTPEPAAELPAAQLPAAEIPAAWPPAAVPEPVVQTPVWTAPADDSAAPTTAIPDWSTQSPVYRVDEPAVQPLTPPPVWTAPVEPPVDLAADLPAEPPVEPSSPYRPWTPDSHVDADAYWNTAQRATVDPEPSADSSVQESSVQESSVPESSAPDVDQLSSPPVWSLDIDEPAVDRYRPWVPEPQPETTPLWEALFPTKPPVAAASPDAEAPTRAPVETAVAQEPTDASPTESAALPEPVAPPARHPAAPVYMSPDDEAATLAAHAPPAGQPWIPQRRSLPDDQLLSVLEAADSKPGGTLDAMDALENEMRLREEEVQEYREWEDSMLAVGTPEALAVVAQVRPEFTAIAIPAELTPTSAIPIQYPAGLQPDADADAPPSDEPWPFSEPGEPEVPLLPEPPLQPVPEPMLPVEPEPPVEPELPAEPAQPEPDAEPDADVPHDMPQSWFDALATPVEADPAPHHGEVHPLTGQTPTFVAQPTGYPVPRFDDLLAHVPESPSVDETPDAAPEVKHKRPFGVAVADGEPQSDQPAEAAPASTRRERIPLFTFEQAGDRPTPRDLRTGRAARMFWLWFAANSSVVSIGMGAMVFSLGMSLRQSIVAALAGVALSLIPLGLGTLAGKRSGQPTMIVSRAVFGLVGNVVPAALAFVSRVFWGAVLLWLFAASISAVVGGVGVRSTAGLVVVFIVVGVMLAVLVAFLGYWLLARVQLVVSIVSAVLIVGFVALTWQYVDVASALTVVDGPWMLVVTGAVAVFSFLGLVWANSASDLARYQSPGSSGGTSMVWAGFGTTLPSFLLVAYGALLAASDRELGERIVADPVGALTGILPDWYPLPLIVATGLSLLSGVVITAYSGAFALQAVGLRVERQWATLVVGALVAVVAVGFSVLDVDLVGVFRDLATTLAVPVAAWAGIFAADTMIRNRPFHTASLLRIGGVYPKVNRVNVTALVAITALGWGLTTATVAGLGWQGYVFRIAGIDLAGDVAASDLGVLVALVLGLLTPLVGGIPAIRRQEAAGRPI
jgi:purine-cytosine permease-like protein